MQYEVEKTSGITATLSVTVPAEDVKQALDVAYKKVSKTAQVPGFRSGKAPRNLLEKHFGSSVNSEVVGDLVASTIDKAISEAKLHPVAYPQIEPGTLSKGEHFTYTANLELKPEIELQKYEGLETVKVDATVDVKDVDAKLETMRQEHSQLVPVKLRDVVEQGDHVVVDYEGTMGGVPFQGGKGTDAIVEIGGHDYIPGFAEGLLGAKVPGTRQIPVDFPKEYSVESLAGKPATFKLQIKEIKTREIPALDDDFAKDLGEDGLEELRNKVIDELKQSAEKAAQEKRKESLLVSLVAANPFDVPPSMIKGQAERMVHTAAERIQMMTGQELKLTDSDFADLAQGNQEAAEFSVRTGLLLGEVAHAAELEIDEAQIEAEIDRRATASGEHAEKLRSAYASKEIREELRYHLLEERVVEFLLEKAIEVESPVENESELTESAGAEPE